MVPSLFHVANNFISTSSSNLGFSMTRCYEPIDGTRHINFPLMHCSIDKILACLTFLDNFSCVWGYSTVQ